MIKKKVIEAKIKYSSLPVQVRAALWFLVCSFFQKGISSITAPIFTRILSAEEYGRFSVFNSWKDIISIFITLQISSGVYMQGLTKFTERKQEYASSMQGLVLLLVALWTAVYLSARDFWNGMFSLTTVQMLAMLLVIWTSSAFGLWSGMQRFEFKYRRLVLLTMLVSVAQPVFGIFLVLHSEDKVTARILGLAAVELIPYGFLAISQIINGKKLYIGQFWRHALVFSIPLIPHCLSQTVLNSSDRIMIEKMVGSGEAGIYSLAYSIALLMTFFTSALNQTLEPWRYAKQKAGKQEDIAGLCYPTLIFVAGISLVLIAFAPEIVNIFAPAEYHDAIWVIPPVCMSTYFTFSYGYFASFEFYFEKTIGIAISTVVAAGLNIVLNYIFIEWFGYYAAGYTTLFCYIVYAACHYLAMRKICRDSLGGKKVYSLKKLLTVSGAFLALGFAIQLTYFNNTIRYAVITVMAAALITQRRWIMQAAGNVLAARGSRKKGESGE